MSTPVIRVKVTPRTVIKGKMDVRFPASVSAESPILLTKAGGSYSFGFDMNVVLASVAVSFEPKIPYPGDAGLFLDGTGNFSTPAGGGDMLASIYDPNAVAGDAFDQDNMADGTTNKNYTATEKTKLAGIASGAEVNVNADWNSSSGGSQILNKPTIGTAANNLVQLDGSAKLPAVDGSQLTNLPSAVDETANYNWTGQHTFTKPVEVNPTIATTGQGFAVTQQPSGTSTASTYYPYNYIAIDNDDADTDGVTGANIAFSVTANFGGSNMKGARIGSYTRVNLTAASSASNLAKEYVGVSGYAVALSADGGTDTGSGAAGSVFASNFVAATTNNITNLLGVVGGEVNILLRSGSTANRKIGWNVVAGSEDAVQGAVWDAAYSVSSQSGSVGWKDGLLFGDANGQFPINANGTIIRATTGSATRGVDFQSVSFSGTAFRSPGFAVGPTGNVNVGTAGSSTGVASFANGTSGSVSIQPVSGALGSSILSLPAKTGVVSVRQDAYKNLGSASTTAVTTIEDLFTYTIPANTLTAGKWVRIKAWGTAAANANTKTVRIHFGSASLGGALPTNATPWHIEANVYVTGSSTQKYDRWGASQSVAMSIGSGSLTETDTSPIIAKVTGQNGTASAGDITCLGFTVEILD